MSTTRLKHHIVVLFCMIVLAAGTMTALHFFIRYLHQQEHALLVAHTRIASYDQNKKIFADESAALVALAERITRVEAYTVTPATTPALLSSLEALAQTHGVEFTINSVQTGKQKTERLVIDFSGSGNMKNLDVFLQDLSRQTYQVKFTKLSLFADRTVAGQWSVLASIQIMSFGI